MARHWGLGTPDIISPHPDRYFAYFPVCHPRKRKFSGPGLGGKNCVCGNILMDFSFPAINRRLTTDRN